MIPIHLDQSQDIKDYGSEEVPILKTKGDNVRIRC